LQVLAALNLHSYLLHDPFLPELLPQQIPVQAENRKHLQELLKVASGGVIFATIQKFAQGKHEKRYPFLSDQEPNKKRPLRQFLSRQN
jgi:hypothetical protein